MEHIRRFFRRLGKGLKEKGYTLIEVAAVVAVTATLTAVVLPIAVDKTKEGKLVAAIQDCKNIGGAITGFYKDVGEWPSHTAVGTVSKSTQYGVAVLKSGNLDSDNPKAEADGINGSWGLTTRPAYNTAFLDTYLVTDFGGSVNGYVSQKYNWRGPYIDSLQKKRDPWGRNYLVYVEAMQKLSGPEGEDYLGTTKQYGWILSAGPDGIIDTGIKDSIIKGDDMGIIHFSLHAKK